MVQRLLLPLLLLFKHLHLARAGSFVYPDFNDTQGLVFNHDAATTSCAHLEGTAMYGDYEGNADKRQHIIGARSRDSQCPSNYVLANYSRCLSLSLSLNAETRAHCVK